MYAGLKVRRFGGLSPPAQGELGGRLREGIRKRGKR